MFRQSDESCERAEQKTNATNIRDHGGMGVLLFLVYERLTLHPFTPQPRTNV